MESLSRMSLPQLRELLSRAPWFAAAHVELIRRVSPIDSGAGSDMEKAALNVWSRTQLYDIVRENRGKEDFTDADITEAIRAELARADEPAEEKTVSENTAGGKETDGRRVVVVGGDYFTREDLDSLRPEDRIFSLLGRSGPDEETDTAAEQGIADRPFDDERFYTETLAAIYAEQGYFDKAKEVYGKLILLYPEKSAYFASLIEKMKQ